MSPRRWSYKSTLCKVSVCVFGNFSMKINSNSNWFAWNKITHSPSSPASVPAKITVLWHLIKVSSSDTAVAATTPISAPWLPGTARQGVLWDASQLMSHRGCRPRDASPQDPVWPRGEPRAQLHSLVRNRPATGACWYVMPGGGEILQRRRKASLVSRCWWSYVAVLWWYSVSFAFTTQILLGTLSLNAGCGCCDLKYIN